MKTRIKKNNPIEPRKSQKYNLKLIVATLDSMTKQCSEIFTDGEQTQEQIDFTAVFKVL